MQIQFVHAPVHTPGQVRAIIAEALEISMSLQPDGDLAVPVFEKVADLLGARASLALPPQPVDLSALALPNGAGR